MKINKLLFFCSAFWFLFLVSGCDFGNSGTIGDSNKNLPNNEVVSIMKNFEKEIGVDAVINEDIFERLNAAEYDYYNYSGEWYYNITWYSLVVTGVKELPNIDKVFDWWYVNYVWDEIWGSAIDFYSDNILCSYFLSLEQEIPSELMAWDWDLTGEDYDTYNATWDDFYDKATYYLNLSCWYLPEWVISYKDFNFYWEWMEPFWYASFRWENIYLFNPEWVNEYSIRTIKKQWDNLTFNWFNVDWILEKAECLDWWKWDIHDYKISFDITNQLRWDDEVIHYDWCADKINPKFIVGEEWTLDTFVKKSNYKYTGNLWNWDIFYSIVGIAWKYMFVNIYTFNWNNYDSYQVLMEEIDDWWNVLYEWDWYGISDEKCEELNQYDHSLMDLFFLISCPRG